MNDISIDILESLLGPDIDPVAAGLALRQIGAAAPSVGLDLLAAIADRDDELAASDPAVIGGLIRGIHVLVLRDEPASLAAIDPGLVVRVQSSLPDECINRFLLLHLLAMAKTDRSLEALVAILVNDPPSGWMEVAHVLSPLMQSRHWSLDAVFPRLLDGVVYPSLVTPVIDVANFATRTGIAKTHPAVGRVDLLNRLLGAVTGQLERFEADPSSLGDDVKTVQDRLSQAVSLSVTLCDALGLIGDATSRPRLADALHLRHRRVQCEAAGALARMRDSDGRERLVLLASEPSARLRVIAYAEELGIADDIDPQYRTESAIAESEVAIWLTQPDRFGVPPTSVDTIDQRRMMWPGFEDPVDCFLVRFSYDLGQRQYSNIAIAGPTVFALTCDVADMQIDDIYAIYAGWQAEHDEIFTLAPTHFNAGQTRVAEQFKTLLGRAEYEDLKPELFGVFLDEHAVVFSAMRDDKPCRVLTDGLEIIPTPVAGRARPLEPVDVWNLFKGRKILRTFNPAT